MIATASSLDDVTMVQQYQKGRIFDRWKVGLFCENVCSYLSLDTVAEN